MLKVKQLIEKQQLFYARISLSAPDYPELSDFKERVDTLIGIYGFSSIKDGLDHLAKRMDDMLDNPPKQCYHTFVGMAHGQSNKYN